MHRRAAHPEQYHLDAIVAREGAAKKQRWTDDEIVMVARVELKLREHLAGDEISRAELARRIIPEMTGSHSGRNYTEESLKGLLKGKRYLDILTGLKPPPVGDITEDICQAVPVLVNTHSDGDNLVLSPGMISDPLSSEALSQDRSLRDAIRVWCGENCTELETVWPDGLLLANAIATDSPDEVVRCVEQLVTTAPFIGAHYSAGRSGIGAPGKGKDNKIAVENRQARYRRLQLLYSKDRRRAAESVLSGAWEKPSDVSVTDAEKATFWRHVFECERISDPDSRISVSAREDLSHPFTVGEVSKVLNSTNPSAAGPDGMRPEGLKGVDPLKIALIANGVLYGGRAPASFLVSRTVLIPKSPTPSTPGEYRPISVSNAMCRLFHRLIALRMQDALVLDHSQKAFRAVDGCAAQVIALETIVEDARRQRRNLSLSFLDMRKAFDSVSHDSILCAAASVGLPRHLLSYLSHYYAEGRTEIYGESVRMVNGVRQGDPLSPILFNAVLDKTVRRVRETRVGYELNGYRFQLLSFADDIVIISSTPTGLQSTCDLVLESLALVGLRPNAAKCATLRLVNDGKRKRSLVDQRPFLRMDGQTVAALSVIQAYKYLGVPVSPRGLVAGSSERLRHMLRELERAPLKPQQRLFMLRTNVLPKLTHELVLGRPKRGALELMDKMIRSFVRRCLHMPKDTPLGFFHASAADGGLNVRSLRVSIPLMRYRRVESLAMKPEPDTLAILKSETLLKLEARLSVQLIHNGTRVDSTISEKKFWRERLYDSLDGKGLALPGFRYKGGGKWLTDGTRLMTGERFIKCVKIRGSVWPTGARNARGRKTTPQCDSGCEARETLGHIIQTCDRTADKRVERHDRVVNHLSRCLRVKGYKVHVEPVLVTTHGNRKPDLVIQHGLNTLIFDVQICADAGYASDVMRRADRAKTARYSDWEVGVQAMELCPGSTEVSSAGLIWTWRGDLYSKSGDRLKSLGLNESALKLAETIVVEGSVACAETWSKRTSRSGGRRQRRQYHHGRPILKLRP